MLFSQSLDGIQLAAIDSLLGRSTDVTVGYIRDFLTAPIDTRIGDVRTIFNLEARTIHYSLRRRSHITILRRCRIGSAVETCQVLVQLDQQFSIFAILALIGYNSDIAIHEIIFLRAVLDFSLDGNCLVQLD